MESVVYSRGGFTTELPRSLGYTRTHFWVASAGDVWRVGFTGFALRVLGELVEWEFTVKPGAAVAAGQRIGWYEGFKGVTDLYCVATGEFVRHNAGLELNSDWIKADPYHKGWLYELRGGDATGQVDADAYVAILDEAITALQGG